MKKVGLNAYCYLLMLRSVNKQIHLPKSSLPSTVIGHYVRLRMNSFNFRTSFRNVMGESTREVIRKGLTVGL